MSTKSIESTTILSNHLQPKMTEKTESLSIQALRLTGLQPRTTAPLKLLLEQQAFWLVQPWPWAERTPMGVQVRPAAKPTGTKAPRAEFPCEAGELADWALLQQWTVPPLQESFIWGLGRAATKTAMKATAKRASLENIVKMSGRLGLQVVNLEAETKLGIRIDEFTMAHDEAL